MSPTWRAWARRARAADEETPKADEEVVEADYEIVDDGK